MRTPTTLVGAVLLLLPMGGCGTGESGRPPAGTPAPSPAAAPPASEPAAMAAALARAARADSVRAFYTDADVAFMSGMIHHHAQALVMARMAPSHGASEAVRTLSERILNGQKDEIALMQRWLRDRGEPVPVVEGMGQPTVAGAPRAADPDPGNHAEHGEHPEHARADHAMAPMAGMLTPEQMVRLDAARGAEWDRLFLTYMIQHHQGALVMVEELFDTHGAGQGDEIFKIASDIGADQATEIDRMQRMLQSLVFGSGDPG